MSAPAVPLREARPATTTTTTTRIEPPPSSDQGPFDQASFDQASFDQGPSEGPTGPAEAAGLSHEERSRRTGKLLARAAAEDDAEGRAALLDEVVVLNMRVAEAVARRYRNRGLPLDDVTQIAYAALVRAVREFDPSQGRDLLSYAVPTMTGEIRRYFRDNGWVVRPPRDVQRAHGRLLRSGADLERVGRAGLDRLAGELGEEAPVIAEALRLRESERALSLEQPPVGGVGEPLANRLAPDEDRDAQRSEARMLLEPALAHLAPSEREVLTWRFVDESSQREIAERLNCSQVQVSRILRRILAELHCSITQPAGQDGTPG